MTISAEDVRRLRQETGAGVMDCKKALQESNGDFREAQKILRKRGAHVAAKKAHRATREGCIGQYVHLGGKIGVLVEVNCETDFVARNEDFQVLVKDLAMQVAASSPRFVRREDLTEDVLEQEREIYRAQSQGKPPHVIEKIVEGKLGKFYEQVCLLEQPFVRDQDRTVKDVVEEAIAKFGENINVCRFVRFAVGEQAQEEN
jgi:elongation factor Ts